MLQYASGPNLGQLNQAYFCLRGRCGPERMLMRHERRLASLLSPT
jgi:hypothetical protein